MKAVASRTKHGEVTRRRILEVSVSLFAEQGLQGVSMREIAAAASVTMPTIYHFYDNKDVLYRAVEDEIYGIYTDELLEALGSSGTPRQRLRTFVDAVMSGMTRNPDYHRIIARALIEQDQGNLAFLVERALRPVMAELRTVIRLCNGRHDEEIDAFFILGSILGFVTMMPLASLLTSAPLPVGTQGEQLIDRVMAAVLPEITPA